MAWTSYLCAGHATIGSFSLMFGDSAYFLSIMAIYHATDYGDEGEYYHDAGDGDVLFSMNVV